MAPRKKRGGKAPVNRKSKSMPKSESTEMICNEEIGDKSEPKTVDESIKTNVNVGTSKSTIVTRAHKKFGKFRFLVENQDNTIEFVATNSSLQENVSSVPPSDSSQDLKSDPLDTSVESNNQDNTPELVNSDDPVKPDDAMKIKNVENDSHIICVSEADIIPEAEVEETKICNEPEVCDNSIEMNMLDIHSFSAHSVAEDNADGTKVSTQNEDNPTPPVLDDPPAAIVIDSQILETEAEFVIKAESNLQEEIMGVDVEIKAEENPKLDENVKETSLESNIVDISKTELSIEEKLEKITMADDNDEVQEKNAAIVERRRSKRKLSQKSTEKLLNPVGNNLKKKNEPEVKIVEDCIDEIKIKVEEIQITPVQVPEENKSIDLVEVLMPVEMKPKLKKNKTPKNEQNTSTPKPSEEKKGKKETKTKKSSLKQKDKKKANKDNNSNTDESNSSKESAMIRRSSRIKSISVLKQKSKGRGLVKQKNKDHFDMEDDNSNSTNGLDSDRNNSNDVHFSVPKSDNDQKPVKVKSRWRRSSELEMCHNSPRSNSPMVLDVVVPVSNLNNNNTDDEKRKADDEEVDKRLKQFIHLKENQYLTDRMSCKEAKKMTCDCFLTQEEIERKEYGCGDDCLNRLLMIECGTYCSVGDRCTNKRFQKGQFAPCEVFKTGKKGLGIRAAANIPYGEFILEYVGEVLDPDEFEKRAEEYSKDKNIHYYFMSLRADAVIDATQKGNISRFINHSCEPNAETQKWTVNGELRIGFFSKKTIFAGEEITFDYQFQRYGKEAQKCYCEAPTCRGWLGEEPDDDEEDDEADDEEEEETEDTKDESVDKIEKDSEKLITKTEDDEQSEVVALEKPVKKERKKVVRPKKPRKDIFDDLDLDEEIETLLTTGLKNQAHTLKLSRLMVRAKETLQRIKLLNILREGEFPCRRLFLDYHGLRLIHGWMTDVPHILKTDKKMESNRLDILQTLSALPIPNKTMLKDSKVLPTVEKWSQPAPDSANSPLDSESNSPKDVNSPPQQQQQQPQILQEEDIKKEIPIKAKVENQQDLIEAETTVSETTIAESTKAETAGVETPKTETITTETTEVETVIAETVVADSQAEVPLPSTTTITEYKVNFQESMDTSPVATPDEKDDIKPQYEEQVRTLAKKLLEDWAGLKEVFRIPKKERIEQMKEHEREADRRYKAGLGLEQEERRSESRYRIHQKCKIEKVELDRLKKGNKSGDHRLNPKLSKYERRKLFAMKVEQEADERRRQQEFWRQHEQNCMMIGADPRFTAPFDPNRGYQYVWNPQTGQWQNYPLPNTSNMPHRNYFNSNNIPLTNIQNNSIQTIPTVNGMTITNVPTNLHNNPNMSSNNIPSPMTNILPLPSLPYQDKLEKEDLTQVKFMGPIPPPVKLPPKWKCAKDKYGRPYYYQIKLRKSQWEPPEFPSVDDVQDDLSETTSSSDTSSLSSDTSSEESDSDDDIDDTKLLLEIRKKFKRLEEETKINDFTKQVEENIEINEIIIEPEVIIPTTIAESSSSNVDEKIEEVKVETEQPPTKKKRIGLVQEIIISPRTEEDRLQFREDLKKYKENKEKLKKQKEIILKQTKKHLDVSANKVQKPSKKHKITVKTKIKEMTTDINSEASRKIKETFRSNMAGVMVSILNPYLKEGKITNTEDFKHLARKLTHFVMLKELKHCQNIEDLICTESVKTKAKEFVKKYMAKFGETYLRPKDDLDSF